ncbi:MAG: glycosyltransferase family 39 protein, partial [Caulobacterales bacterium]|nr:glycosyltransferase family 39 protein [Caulobacterales bacterium]
MKMDAAPARIGADAMTARDWLIVLAVLVLALAPGLFSIPVMDRDEARYAQASVQMLETGDFIDIRFQDQARHVKPVGIYWMQAASASVFGGADAPIWAFRLPSVLGILIACVATGVVGVRIGGREVGLTAAIVLGLTLAAAVEARTAKTDAMLLASAAIAQGALYVMLARAREAAARFIGAPLIFWLAIGASIMIKGPIVAMVSAVTIAGYALWMRDRTVLGRLRLAPGLAVVAAVALPWLVTITIQTEGAFLQQSIGHALMGKVAESNDGHAGPFGYHTLLLPVTFWPGVLLLGLGAAAAWRRRNEPAVRFLLVWILPTWLIFEFVQTKLPHYVLPTFPALAILAGLGLADAASLRAERLGRVLHAAFAVLFVLVALVIAALAGVASAELGGEAMTAVNVTAAVAGVIAAIMGVIAALKPDPMRLGALIASAIAVYWAMFEGAIPRIDGLWPSHRAAAIVVGLDGCEALTTATAGYREPSNVFYLGTETVLGDGPDAADVLIADPACGAAVVDASHR